MYNSKLISGFFTVIFVERERKREREREKEREKERERERERERKREREREKERDREKERESLQSLPSICNSVVDRNVSGATICEVYHNLIGFLTQT